MYRYSFWPFSWIRIFRIRFFGVPDPDTGKSRIRVSETRSYIYSVPPYLLDNKTIAYCIFKQEMLSKKKIQYKGTVCIVYTIAAVGKELVTETRDSVKSSGLQLGQ